MVVTIPFPNSGKILIASFYFRKNETKPSVKDKSFTLIAPARRIFRRAGAMYLRFLLSRPW